MTSYQKWSAQLKECAGDLTPAQRRRLAKKAAAWSMKSKLNRALVACAEDIAGEEFTRVNALACAEHCESLAAVYRIIAEGTPPPLPLTPSQSARN